MRQGVHDKDGRLLMVLPAIAAGDHYTAALAIVAGARQARQLVDAADRATVTSRLRAAASPDELNKSIAGPAAAVALLRADNAAGVLSDTQRDRLKQLLGNQMGRPAVDVYEATANADLAELLGQDLGGPRRELAAYVARRPTGCNGSESLFALGAAVHHIPDSLGCNDEQLSRLWESEAKKALAHVGPADSKPGLGEGEAVLALARIAVVKGYSEQRRNQVATLISATDAALTQARAADPVPVLADLSLAADLLGLSRTVDPSLMGYLAEVIRGDGDAALLELDPSSQALLLRVIRALDEPIELQKLPDNPVNRLDMVLATTPAPPLSDADLLSVRRATESALAQPSPPLPLAMRALAVLGVSGCTLAGAVPLASKALEASGSRDAGDSATRAIAVRFLDGCHVANSSTKAAREQLLTHSSTILQRTSEPSTNRPSLIEAWQAAAIACALDPSQLAGLDLWSSYNQNARAAGGAADSTSSFVSIEMTYFLATLTRPDRTSCSAVGLLS